MRELALAKVGKEASGDLRSPWSSSSCPINQEGCFFFFNGVRILLSIIESFDSKST